MPKLLTGLMSVLIVASVAAAPNQIDIIRHDAPELAYFGEFDIGVRTLQMTNAGQIDVLNSSEAGPIVRYNRELIVEVWYPAILADRQASGGLYETATRNLAVTAKLQGRAVRDAVANTSVGPLPLVIISHGYPGNRYLMSHLGENLASKGYVVASIDHTESTYHDQASIWSTLYHRPIDQLFVIDQLVDLSKSNNSFLNQLIIEDSVAIVGYSMGGYGVLINAGAGYSAATEGLAEDLPPEVTARHAASNEPSTDARIKAVIAIGPCCMNRGMWDQDGLRQITTPVMFMGGSIDETSGYMGGIRALFEAAVNSDRYLLTFLNAGHNAIAPIPLPVEIHESEDQAGAFHYTDAVWDSVKSSNIMFHFATAFLDYHLKGDATRKRYLDVIPFSQQGVWSVEDGEPTPEHSYWTGFPRYSARGLVLEYREPQAGGSD